MRKKAESRKGFADFNKGNEVFFYKNREGISLTYWVKKSRADDLTSYPV